MSGLKEKLAGIVGSSCVSDDESTLLEYSKDRSFAKLPQPLVTAYQYKVREAVNPKHLCGSYYRTLTSSKIGA